MSYDPTYKYTKENNLFQKLKEKGVAREKLGAPENIKSGGTGMEIGTICQKMGFSGKGAKQSALWERERVLK